MINLAGKGFFIWKIAGCESGDANAIALAADQAGCSHVLVKIADGTRSYNIDSQTGVDLLPAVVQALRARKIKILGWHYVYGFDPLGEANKAVQRVQQLRLDGYVIDAEAEYKQPGKSEAARRFMTQLRTGLPGFPVALTSYRYPSYHPQFPWRAFLEKCDLNMPQVYWMQNHNPGEQLTRCVNEFQALVPFRPIIPVGAAFCEDNWSPTTSDVKEFLQTAQRLNLRAANFWEWSNCRSRLPDIWREIADYDWPVHTTPDICQQYISALNSHDPNKVVNLYYPSGVHVTALRTVQGTPAIHNWYTNFFSQTLPDATFLLTSFSGTGSSRYLTWTALSNAGRVQNGSDTLGLINGKIAYHYTFFSVS